MAQPQGEDKGAHVLVRVRVGHEDSSPGPVDLSYQLTVSNVHKENSELEVIDLYAVRTESKESREKGARPFIHQVKLHGPGGEIVRVWGLFDDGAMVDAMSTKVYNQIGHRLSPLGRSTRQLRMANGNVVKPLGCWKGKVELGSTAVEGSFEVFDSGGGWDFLFGKRLMMAFAEIHDYAVDEVFIPEHQLTLENQHDIAMWQRQACYKPQAQNREKEHKNKEGDEVQSPMRGVLTNHVNSEIQVVDTRTSTLAPHTADETPQEQLATADKPENEEQERLVGDKVTSPSREVPAIIPTRAKPAANKNRSYRTSVEEVEDKDDKRYKTSGEQKKVETAEEQLAKQQNVDREEQQRLKSKGGEKVKTMWKIWRGPSQRRHCRWKTRNTSIARVKRRNSEGGTVEPPVREVSDHDCVTEVHATDEVKEVPSQSTTPVCVITEDTAEADTGHTVEIPTDDLAKDTANLFTHATEPFKPARVKEIQRQVEVGDNLTDAESTQVQALIAEFADVFALSVSEVKQVDGAVHRLNIEPDAKFSTKVHQKPLTPPQRRYLHEKLQGMLDADIIEPCEPGQVKCVSPTMLAQKTHKGAGLTLNELQHRVNEECVHNGLEPHFLLPPRPQPATNDSESKEDEPKWRICQNFSQINKVIQVAPMPQGDIHGKQQRLSGHRWVSMFDLAAGFYAVLVNPESRPYTAFYVEGWGYFWYK